MPKRTGDFNAWRLQKLSDPIEASSYLNAALKDSTDVFLAAVKDVIKAQESITTVAKKAGLTRESLHRSFSSLGNPTVDTLTAVLAVLGLKVTIAAESEVESHSTRIDNIFANTLLTDWTSAVVAVAQFAKEQIYYVGPGAVKVPIYQLTGGGFYGHCNSSGQTTGIYQ